MFAPPSVALSRYQRPCLLQPILRQAPVAPWRRAASGLDPAMVQALPSYAYSPPAQPVPEDAEAGAASGPWCAVLAQSSTPFPAVHAACSPAPGDAGYFRPQHLLAFILFSSSSSL